MRLWQSAGMAPHIFNFGIRWKQAVHFMFWLLYATGRYPPYNQCIMDWMGPRTDLNAVEKKFPFHANNQTQIPQLFSL
jgi:hypothetical protein